MCFLTREFLNCFVQKSTQMLFQCLYPLKCLGLQKNGKRHMIFCYKNKYANKFHALTIKIDIRNMSESKEFRWENDSKLAQDLHFFIFFS